jgi:hypothetical protein
MGRLRPEGSASSPAFLSSRLKGAPLDKRARIGSSAVRVLVSVLYQPFPFASRLKLDPLECRGGGKLEERLSR